jgi:hypothetical protein
MTLEQLRALKNEMNRLFNLTMGMSGPGQLDLDKLAKGEQKTLDCVTAMLAEKNTEIAALKARIADLEGFEPLPILNRDEDSIVRSMASREIWRRSAMSDWAQAAVITLEEKGLLCEDDCDPDTIYITNAGKAYVVGERLPKIVIPPYKE